MRNLEIHLAAAPGRSVIRFFRPRLAGADKTPTIALGHLEMAVMEILWAHGENNVHGVMEKLDRPLAYTTVMTTLDRLFKKGLLQRRKFERAFIYSPRLSRREWEQKRAGDWVAGFLSDAQPSGELLVSCLIEAIGRHDQSLLDQLEKEIRLKRRELLRNSQSAEHESTDQTTTHPARLAAGGGNRGRKP